jgi:hypothetical protein
MVREYSFVVDEGRQSSTFESNVGLAEPKVLEEIQGLTKGGLLKRGHRRVKRKEEFSLHLDDYGQEKDARPNLTVALAD